MDFSLDHKHIACTLILYLIAKGTEPYDGHNQNVNQYNTEMHSTFICSYRLISGNITVTANLSVSCWLFLVSTRRSIFPLLGCELLSARLNVFLFPAAACVMFRHVSGIPYCYKNPACSL